MLPSFHQVRLGLGEPPETSQMRTRSSPTSSGPTSAPCRATAWLRVRTTGLLGGTEDERLGEWGASLGAGSYSPITVKFILTFLVGEFL